MCSIALLFLAVELLALLISLSETDNSLLFTPKFIYQQCCHPLLSVDKTNLTFVSYSMLGQYYQSSNFGEVSD